MCGSASRSGSQARKEAKFKEETRRIRRNARLKTIVVERAMAALRAGDAEARNT
jgi:hypothetical protein